MTHITTLCCVCVYLRLSVWGWGHCKPIRKHHLHQYVKCILVLYPQPPYTHTHTSKHTPFNGSSIHQQWQLQCHCTNMLLTANIYHNHLGGEGWKWMSESRQWMFQGNWICATGIHGEMFAQGVFQGFAYRRVNNASLAPQQTGHFAASFLRYACLSLDLFILCSSSLSEHIYCYKKPKSGYIHLNVKTLEVTHKVL